MAKESKGWAFIGTLPIIGFILVYLANKSDKYAMFYGKQGLALGIAAIVIQVLLTILVITIPLIFVWNIAVLVLWIISVVNAMSGKMKPTPLIGRFASKF
ncbi:MAG: hypothetical protein QW165_04165 [Candidatus Woesearchaeota archaeon]